jgi:tetratricopeptide (TPR) repeat protein
MFAALLIGRPIHAQEAKPAQEPAKSLSDKELYKALLPSVAWIRTSPTNDPQGGMGTGFVVDVARRLVVTNEHVVRGFSDRGFDEMVVHFAEHDANGKLIVDPKHYFNKADALRGEVIHRDTAKDLALIQLPSLPATAKPISFAADLPEPGERVASIAGLPEGSEGVWIMSVGSVRMSYRRSHANGAVAGVVESDMPTNRGNSGGPIVNDRNELVAVCEGHMIKARLVAMYIDVNEVKTFLKVCDPLIEPQTAESFHDRGQLRHNSRRYELALKDYSQALKLDPKFSLAMVNRGWTLFSMQDFATAEADFDAALKVDPENGSAYEGRGVCRRERGQTDEALADFTQAIRRAPDYAHLYFRRSIAHRQKNDWNAALGDLNRCIALEPNNADQIGSRGQVHLQLKNYPEAIADFEAASRLEPREAGWWYEAARVFYFQQKYQGAINLLNVAITLNADQPSYYNDRGLAYFNSERYAESLADFQAALKLNPKSAKYAEHCGDNLWYLKRYREAWDFYNQAIQLEPTRASAWKSRGDVYRQLGDTAQANRDYAKARELGGK